MPQWHGTQQLSKRMSLWLPLKCVRERPRSEGVPDRWGMYLERSSLWCYVCSVAGRLRAAVEDRTFSPLLQCCLTVDLLYSYSGPWNGFSIKATLNILFDDDDDDDRLPSFIMFGQIDNKSVRGRSHREWWWYCRMVWHGTTPFGRAGSSPHCLAADCVSCVGHQ